MMPRRSAHHHQAPWYPHSQTDQHYWPEPTVADEYGYESHDDNDGELMDEDSEPDEYSGEKQHGMAVANV